MNKILITIIIVVVIAGLGWYLTATYNDNDTTNENTNSITVTSNTNAISNINDTETMEPVDYEISMTEYTYSITDINIGGPEKTISVKLTNDGTMAHDFVIDELNVDSGLIQPGDSEVIDITSGTVASTFDFYCSVGNHRTLGMFGRISQ